MKKLTLLFSLSILTYNLTIAQTTAIPDANFEQELINLGLDGTIDGMVLTQNIDTLTYLYLQSKSISDLTGIEDFTAITSLNCRYNSISNIDVTQCALLEVLDVRDNVISNIDITQNTILTWFGCNNNQITSLDVSQHTSLEYLYCSYNNLTALNVSNNTTLDFFNCDNNNLNCLNVKNGNNINAQFFAKNNPNLICIEVDDDVWATTNWSAFIDVAASFSTNCPNPCGVGIEENSLSNLSIYPNPTNGNITIDLGELKNKLKATLTNSLGQVVLTQNHASTNLINLGLDYPKGLYFLSLETDGEVITKKIVLE